MRWNRFYLILAAVALLCAPAVVVAQDDVGEGKIQGNFNVHQTLEMGWQATSREGSEAAYGTFVNLDDGFRIFDQSMQMRSLNHMGTIFDNFYESSFGFGGDPNQVARLRMSKNKWYNFNASFRRDYTAWNYDLTGNPLNPPNVTAAGTPSASFPLDTAAYYSPKAMDTVRRMADFNLILAPQSRLRGRLGFNRTTTEGPQLITYENPKTALFQRTRWIQDSYQMGLDFRPFARTVISYDQHLQNYKQDPKVWDNLMVTPFGNLNIGGGPYVVSGTQIPFDIGAIVDPLNNQPCSGMIPSGAPPVGTPPGATPIKTSCTGFQFYGGIPGTTLPTSLVSYLSTTPRTNPETFWTPTEMISLQSNYWKDVDIVGRFSYSKSDVNFLWNELGMGLVSRTNERQWAFYGPGGGSRYVANGDFAVTWRISDRLHLSDAFQYNNFRLPSFWTSAENSLFAPDMNPATVVPDLVSVAANCTSANASSTNCPGHTSSSPADVGLAFNGGYLDQNIKSNKVEVGYDFTKRVGLRLGYRFTDRQISDRSLSFEQQLYYPGYRGTAPAGRYMGYAARGSCAEVQDPVTLVYSLPADCTVLTNGAIAFDNTANPVLDAGWLPIHEHGALGGLFFRPIDELRMNFDVEFTTASSVCPLGDEFCQTGQATVTRISPRQMQHYNFRTKWSPRPWLALNGSVNIIETRNNSDYANYLGHNRYYGFGATINRSDRWSADFGYNYNDVSSAINDCFVGYAGTSSNPVFTGSSSPCTLPTYTAAQQVLPPTGSGYQGARSLYTDATHYAYFNLMLKPVKKVTFIGGLDVLSVGGNALLTGAYWNPQTPLPTTPATCSTSAACIPLSTLGPQDYTFYRPTLGLAVAVSKEVTLKTNWRYYDYNENTLVSTTQPRNFNSHVVDVGLRYAF